MSDPGELHPPRRFGELEVYTISPRTKDPQRYWSEIERCVDWSEECGLTGVLLFTGNDTYIEPWAAAQAACARTRHLSPLVAVNPIYMHPFTTAKMISSIAQLYGRRVTLNMVTGTALSYLSAVDDQLDHDERYERLREHAEVVNRLLAGGAPLRYDGRFYRTNNLTLEPDFPAELMPGFLFAGQSDAAVETARAVGGVHMQMLPPDLAAGMTRGAAGVHFGLVTRATDEEAWAEARRLFPEDRRGRRLLKYSMSNTDSVWKKRLERAARMEERASPEYWLDPFRNFRADCPYVVGGLERATEVVVELVEAGVRTFILDLAPEREEFERCREVFRAAAARIAGNAASAVG